MFQLLIHSNEGILQRRCQHPKHWFLQWRTRHSKHQAKHTDGLHKAPADLVPGEVRQGELIVMNYSCAHAALVEGHAQVCACDHPEYGPNVMRHEVVVDIQGQGQLRVDLNRRSLNHSQAVRVHLRTTCKHTCTHTFIQNCPLDRIVHTRLP